MEQVGAFVLEQLLKMQWLSTLFENLLVLFGVEVSTPIGASLHFFPLRHRENRHFAYDDDFCHRICSDLLSSGEKPKDYGPL